MEKELILFDAFSDVNWQSSSTFSLKIRLNMFFFSQFLGGFFDKNIWLFRCLFVYFDYNRLMHFQMSIGSSSTFSVKILLNMWMRLNKAWQVNAASVLGTETWSWRSLDASPTAFNRRKIQEMQLSMSLSASVSDSWYVSHPM